MGVEDDATVREATFFREVMDPFVHSLLGADDPWEAYETVARMRSAMTNYLEWGPHGGAVFMAWADFEDLYDTGKTSASEAHVALRQAATGWLARPPLPEQVAYIEQWIAQAGRTVSAIIDRDGDFWTSPS